MLKNVHFENYKCYKNTKDVSTSRINLLIGCNNIGKTAFLQPLLLLKQTVADKASKASLVTSGSVLDIGTYGDVVNNESEGNISFKFRTDDKPFGFPNDMYNSLDANEFGVEYNYDKNDNRIYVASQSYYFDGKSVLTFKRNKTNISVTGSGITSGAKGNVEASIDGIFGRVMPNFKQASKKEFNDLTSEVFGPYLFADALATMWQSIFESIEYIAPVRTRVPWYSSLGKRHAYAYSLGGDHIIRMLASDESISKGKSLEELLNAVNSEKFGVEKFFLKNVDEAGNLKSLFADDAYGRRMVNVAAMGEGISQILPILLICLRDTQPKSVVIEQPELHLHPSAQCDLMDFLIQVSESNRKQLFIETHSEHMLLRLRRRIAEGKLDPDQVRVLFFEKGTAGTSVRNVEIDESGHVNDWPEGFFDDAYVEAMQLAMAQAKRGPVSKNRKTANG